LERALVAMLQAALLQATTSGTPPQPNSGTPKGDVAVRAESGAADKEHVHPENVHDRPESKNERRETAHGRNAPDDQDGDIGCI
jgi:hypothetical protein